MSPIKLAVEISSPLGEEDRELLSGIAVMTLAIANHEMAKAKFPEAFTDDEEPETAPEAPAPAPAPCGMMDEQGRVCIAKSGHRGRHAMRAVQPAFPN